MYLSNDFHWSILTPTAFKWRHLRWFSRELAVFLTDVLSSPCASTIDFSTQWNSKLKKYAIKSICEALSSIDLLNRCLGGYTQNSNESFNSLVWSIAPKSQSNGKIVDIVYNLVVSIFNSFTSILEVMQVLNLTIGLNC